MSRTDRFNSPAEVERLADMKRSVDLVALATQRYNMMITDKGRNGEGVELRNSPNGDGPRITVKTGPEGYQIYNNHNDSRDKGTVVDFLQQRHPERNLGQVKGMLQEMIPGARQALQIEQQQDQLNRKGVSADEARYNDLPPTDRRAVMVNETTGNRGQRGQPPLAITDSSYLVSRGLSLDTLADPAFENRVFNDQLKSRTDRASGAPHNTAFPFYNGGGIQSFELRNFPAPGKTESWKGGMSNPEDGQNSKNGVWSSNLTQGRNVQAGQLIIGESPIDMMSKFQLEKEGRAPGQEADNVRYVATGGPASVAQKAILQDLIDRDQPRQITLANDNDAAGKAFNIRYLNDLRAPQNGLDEQQKQQSNEAAAAVSWSVTTNGKRGEERAFAMTIELVTTSSGQGRELMEGIREQARRLGLPTESPELAGGVGFDQRTNKGPESSLVLRVPEAQGPELLALAYELRETRERSLPEVARTPANYFVVETATGKDYNQDVQQGRYDAQLAEQRREAGLSQGSVVAPEASPVTAQVVPGAVPGVVPEVVLERAQIRVSENEPMPDGVTEPRNLSQSSVSDLLARRLQSVGLEVESSPVPTSPGEQQKTYLEFSYAAGTDQAQSAGQFLREAMLNAPGRINPVGIEPFDDGYDRLDSRYQQPSSYAPVGILVEDGGEILRGRLSAATISWADTQVADQPGLVVLLRPENLTDAAVLQQVLDLHETETGRAATVLQSGLTAGSREHDVNAYYGETAGVDRVPPAITGLLEVEDNGYMTRGYGNLLERLEMVGATVNPREEAEQGPQDVDGIRPIFVIEYPLDRPEVAANVDRLLQEGLRENEYSLEAENGDVRAGREALRKREGDAGVDLELVGHRPEAVAYIRAGRGDAIQVEAGQSAEALIPGQQLTQADISALRTVGATVEIAGDADRVRYPLSEPEMVARVSALLDNFEVRRNEFQALQRVDEEPGVRENRQQVAQQVAFQQPGLDLPTRMEVLLETGVEPTGTQLVLTGRAATEDMEQRVRETGATANLLWLPNGQQERLVAYVPLDQPEVAAQLSQLVAQQAIESPEPAGAAYFRYVDKLGETAEPLSANEAAALRSFGASVGQVAGADSVRYPLDQPEVTASVSALLDSFEKRNETRPGFTEITEDPAMRETRQQVARELAIERPGLDLPTRVEVLLSNSESNGLPIGEQLVLTGAAANKDLQRQIEGAGANATMLSLPDGQPDRLVVYTPTLLPEIGVQVAQLVEQHAAGQQTAQTVEQVGWSSERTSLGYPGVATAAVGYPGTEDLYKQQLIEAGATLIERPVTELAPAGSQSLSYPLNEPELVARVSLVLDEIDSAAKARTANVGTEAGPIGVYEEAGYRETRQQAAIDYPQERFATPQISADIDNNGSTSQAEILRADSNRDGVVTGTELNTARFEIKQAEQEPLLAAELTNAERIAEIKRVYEAQRLEIEAQTQAESVRRSNESALNEGRAANATILSAGIIITEAEPLPVGTLGPQSLTLLQLSDQMREALEPLSSTPLTANAYRDRTTDAPAVMLSFSYYADTPQHAAMQQILRDGAELGGVKAFGIKPGEEPTREVAREPALFARVIALSEQPLAIAQETPNLLLQSQLGATGARVTAEPVQERPGLVVVVDTFKGEQLAGVAQILAQLPASSLVVESPEAQQTRQQSTQDFRRANGVAPALTTEALLNDPREADVAERLRTAGAVVVPVAAAVRPELPQGGLSVVYSLEKPEVIGKVSVVLDDINARGLQLAIDLGKNPTLAKGVVVESELAQQTRQQVAKDNGLEATVPRQMPLAQPSVDVPLPRPQSVVLPNEPAGPISATIAEPVRVSVAEPVPSAIERRLTLEIKDQQALMTPTGNAIVLDERLRAGGFEVKTPSPQAAGQEDGISRVEVLYRTTDSAVLRVLQQAELQKMVKMEGVTFIEPAGQAQERLDATKSIRPEMGADGKVDASKMSKAGQVLQTSITVHEPEGDTKRTDKLWTDLRKEGGQMVNISKVDLGAQGAQFSFKADFSPSDSRLLAASAILEAAARSEGIQVTETTNARRERLSRADLLENKARLTLPAEQQHTHVKKTAAEYPAALPETFERVALSSAALKTEAGMKELRAELKQSGANVAVQQVDGQPANSGIVQLSYLREQPKAEALNAVLEKFTENGGAVYDLKAGRDRNAAPELSVAPVAFTDREANTLETRSLEARQELLKKELKAESDRAALAEMQHLPAVVLAPGVGAPGVEQEPVKPWAGTGHDLRVENMRDTDAAGIDLRGANLAGQDLRSTLLLGSDLRGANLSDTDLRGVNLTGVRLEDALLTGAQLDKAYRIVEGPDGRRSVDDNLSAAQLTAPETAAERAERAPLSVPAERTLNTGLSAEENGAASAPRVAMLQAPQYAGLDLPTEEELRLRTQPVPAGPEASLPPRMSLPTEEGMKIAEISNQPAGAAPELVAPVVPTPEVPAQERAERAPSTLSAYEQSHEKGTEYHLAEIYVTQPLGTEAALAASAALGQATETDRTSAVLERLTAAGAEVRRESGALPDENGKTETTALSVVYTHDDRQLPAIHQALNEVASPNVDGSGVRVVDEEAAARAATVGSRLENTQEAARGLAVQLHDGDVSTARVLVERPSLEDVLALQGAGAAVERIYLPEGPAAVVSYPANEEGVTGLVSIELDRIARDSGHSRPPHNSLEHEISGPLHGEDPAQQERRQALATTEGLVLEPRPRYELNEMAERDTRAKDYFAQETARPSDALGGQLANGEPFTGGLTEAIRLEQPDREAVENSWRSGRTTMILTVLETPELSSGDGSHYAPYPDKVAAALQQAGAETEVTAMGVSKDTGLDRHLISVSFENNSPELARIQATLNRLSEQDGVLVPVEGFWQRERVLGPNGSHGAEPVLAERERPWLEAVSAILEPTAQERRELTRAGARLEDTVFEGREEKAAVRVFYDLDNPLMVGRISPILDRATEDGRGMGEVVGVREARHGRAEQLELDIRQGKEIGGERAQPESEKNGNLSFVERFRAAVDYQLEEIRSGWEKGSPENLKIAFAEQQGRQDRANADQIAAEKAAYDRGYKGAETPAPAGAEVAVAAVMVEAVTAEKAALAGNVMASATGGMVGGTAGSAAEASGEKVLRERRDDERTVPIVMDAPKEGKILEVREQLTPATAGVSDREKKDGEQTPPPVPPVIAVAQATVVTLTPERELQHGIISMEASKSHTADERVGMVRESMVAAGAQVGTLIPSTRDHSEASLPYAFDPRGAHLATVNVVLHDVHTAQPSRVVEEPHSQRFAGIVANTHEIPKQDWPEREGQFAKAHIIIDDADHKGEARAGRVREAFGGGGVVVSEAKKDGHGHVEMDVSYHTHSPNIEKINNTLDKAGNTAGIEVQETSVDRSARYQGANDLQAAKSKDQERERGD